MKILITGDLVVNVDFLLNQVNNDVVQLFESSDFNIVNLESPVTDSNEKIIKTGPHLKANKSSTKDLLQLLNIDLVTLANNHILDYGEEGVLDTLGFCNNINIKTVGANTNLETASHPFIIEKDSCKIAIVNFAENEWCGASENSAGANPMNVVDNFRQIQNAKKLADFVIVIIHGGHEYNNLPSPRMQKQYRFYADVGANLIVGHHTHCISGNEIYNGVPIYYSLGNFLFTNSNKNEDWYNGLILEVEISENSLRCEVHPVKQEKENFNLSLQNMNEKRNTLNRISMFNNIITDEVKLNFEWKNYVAFNYTNYLFYWSPLNFIKIPFIKTIFKKLGLPITNTKGMSLQLNLMRCEAHYDLSKEIISKFLKKNA